MSDSAHATALRKQDKLNRLAKERLRVANGKVEKYKAAPPVQDIEAVIAAEKLANPDVGDLVPGKGVFFGKFRFKDEKGNLKKTFDMYAAPENLTDKAGNKSFSYPEAVEGIAKLKDWHGHNGMPYATEAELFKALEESSYDGGWFMPTADMLRPTDEKGNILEADNLYSSQNKGKFKGTFRTAAGENTYPYDTYWGSTQMVLARFHVQFLNGLAAFGNNEENLFFCRPVRLELARLEPVS